MSFVNVWAKDPALGSKAVADTVAAAKTAKYAIGTIVETKGFTTEGIGSARYLVTSGDTADGYVTHLDTAGNTLTIMSDGVLDFKQCGAVTDGSDVSANIQACFDYCRVNNLTWVGTGTFNLGSTTVTNYTAGDGSKVIFTSTADGQSVPVFVTTYVATDYNSSDTTLLAAAQALLPFKKGQAVISGLSAYAGKLVRLQSTDDYITRYGGDPYRHEILFEVLDSDGNIYPPLPFEVANTVTLTGAKTTVLQEPIVVQAPTVKLISGSSARTDSIIEISRPRTTVVGGGVLNETTEELAIGVKVDYASSVTLEHMSSMGAKENATNYAYSLSGAGITLVNCKERDSRRGVDGSYATTINISGGQYPDGVGGHLVFGLSISNNAYIGFDSPNSAPVFVTGGDTSVDNCTLTMKETDKGFLSTRSDITEHIGRMSITNCRLICDFTSETTAIEFYLFRLAAPNGSHNCGRTIKMPSHIIATGNTIEVLGASHTGTLYLLELTNGFNNLVNNTEVDTRVDMHSNSLVFENGAPQARINGTKRTTFTGDGWVFNIADLEDLLVYWGALSGTSDTLARADFYIERVRDVNMRTDGGATHKHYIDCEDYVYSAAIDVTALVGDEQWWNKMQGGLYQNNSASLADDAVLSFALGDSYGTYLLTERNGGATGFAAIFIVDAAGGLGITILSSTGATIGKYTSALTGTTGTDAQFNIAVDSSGIIYLENRTGSAIPLLVNKLNVS